MTDKKLARVKARAERRKAAEAETLTKVSTNQAVEDLRAKLANGQKVTPAQMANARATADLQALHDEVLAQQAEAETRARRARAVQVATDARDQWQILRDDAHDRATQALEQVVRQVLDELQRAYAPINAAHAEMKASGVSPYTIDSLNVQYSPMVDAVDVAERALASVKRRWGYGKD